MEEALLLQNPHWDNRPYEELFYRQLFQNLLRKSVLKEIQILLGIRRSGKSTLFKLLINELLKDEQVSPASILYVNLDDPYFSDVWKDATQLYRVLEISEQLSETPIQYLFLDEVQNVEGWEKFVKSQYDSERFQKIWITGSNSTLLEGEYASLLSGRYVKDFVHPLSYEEILLIEGIQSYSLRIRHKAKALSLLESQVRSGSFPEVWKLKDVSLKREVLQGYLDTILLKDCIQRYQIREFQVFKEFCLYMLANSGALYSYNSLKRAIGGSENTLKNFLYILQEAFLFKEITTFSYSQKPSSKRKKKSYCLDNGLIAAAGTPFSKNHGKLLENFVFTELFRNPNVQEVAFYNEEVECDFIIRTDHGLVAIQVAYEITPQNQERELRGLEVAMKDLRIEQGVILTFNQEVKLSEQHTTLPYWKYVL